MYFFAKISAAFMAKWQIAISLSCLRLFYFFLVYCYLATKNFNMVFIGKKQQKKNPSKILSSGHHTARWETIFSHSYLLVRYIS
jgi:hypothetical protein